MFKVKAIKGDIDLSVFNLDELIEKANNTANEIKSHNEFVKIKFTEMVVDYISTINEKLNELGINIFKTESVFYNGMYDIREHSNGLLSYYSFNANRFGEIRIEFETNKEDEKLTCNWIGKIIVRKLWQEKMVINRYHLKSVEQFFNVCEDIIKVAIIEKKVKNETQKKKLITEIPYKIYIQND